LSCFAPLGDTRIGYPPVPITMSAMLRHYGCGVQNGARAYRSRSPPCTTLGDGLARCRRPPVSRGGRSLGAPVAGVMWPTVEGRATPPRVRNRSKFHHAGQEAWWLSLTHSSHLGRQAGCKMTFHTP
jgi:hypothetical protein